MNIYISFDGDEIGARIGRARLADDIEEVRRVNQSIDHGNEIWKSFALRVGGSIVEIGGDEGALEIPADYLDELPKIRTQYASAVGASVSVGVGMKLSESAKALLVAKLQGKDKIVFFTEECDKAISEAQKKQKSGIEKELDEYLTKADPAMNQGAFAGASHPSGPSTNKPAGPAAETSENAELYNLINDDDRPPAPESTHAARDFEDEMHGHAQAQEKSDHEEDVKQTKDFDGVKQTMVQALQTIKAQAPVMDQLRQTAPDLYQAMIGLTQSVIGLAKQLPGSKPKSMQKAEPRVTVGKNPKRADDSDIYSYVKGIHTGPGSDLNKIPMDVDFRLADIPLEKLPALRPPDTGHVIQYSKLKTPFPPIVIGRGGSIPDGHHRIAAARLRGDKTIRAYVPHEELENYMPKQMKKSETMGEGHYPKTADDSQILTYFRSIHTGSRADLKRVPYDTEYELKNLLVSNLISGCDPENAIAHQYSMRTTPYPPIIMKSEKGTNPLDGNHRVLAAKKRGDKTIRAYVPKVKKEEISPTEEDKEKQTGTPSEGELEHQDNLDKGALPMPKATTRHHVVLPVGSVQGDKQKVMHSSGKQGWVQMGSGMIRSQDPAGHPVSSRNPMGKREAS